MTINRRTFLLRGSGAVAALGAASALPSIVPALAGAGTLSTHHPSTDLRTNPEADLPIGSESEPLVAHVRNLTTGEIGLFSGEQETVIHDRQLARLLYSATR